MKKSLLRQMIREEILKLNESMYSTKIKNRKISIDEQDEIINHAAKLTNIDSKEIKSLKTLNYTRMDQLIDTLRKYFNNVNWKIFIREIEQYEYLGYFKK